MGFDDGIRKIKKKIILTNIVAPVIFMIPMECYFNNIAQTGSPCSHWKLSTHYIIKIVIEVLVLKSFAKINTKYSI